MEGKALEFAGLLLFLTERFDLAYPRQIVLKLGNESANTPKNKEKDSRDIAKPYIKGEKILGYTLTYKTVGAKGKTYVKRYATKTYQGKQVWIYIGNGDPESKIRAKMHLYE